LSKKYFVVLNIFTLLCFLGLVGIPSINKKFKLIHEVKGNENRFKNKMPDFDFRKPDNYITGFDKYYTDNFSLRDNYIKYYNNFEYYLFGVSPVPDEVIVGRQGWFYLQSCVANYKGTNCFSADEISRICRELEFRTKWCRLRNARYYVVIVPDKMTIYPEYLPDQVIKVKENNRYDQMAQLDGRNGISIIDLKKRLLQHKRDGYDIYQHTDDHWNDLGAYYGYQEILTRLSNNFTALSPLPLSDYAISIEKRAGDLTKMMNIEDHISENFIQLTYKNKEYAHDGVKRGYPVPDGVSDWDAEIVKANENGKKLKCLITRDSYTLKMVQYLQEHFKECVFIHDAWKYKLHEEIIQKENPDIVMSIIIETNLGKLLENSSSLGTIGTDSFVNLRAANGKYLCIDSSRNVVAGRKNASLSETFVMSNFGNNYCGLRDNMGTVLTAELNSHNQITASRDRIQSWETFQIVAINNHLVALKAANKKYISVDANTGLLFANADSIGTSEKFEIINIEFSEH
jgi:hypothetical protein